MKKIKIISLFICMIFITGLFPGMTTAKDLVSINASVIVESDLIKITDDYAVCDMDNNFVVYADSVNLYIYNIETGDTDVAFMGGDVVFPKISENIVVYYDFVYMGFKSYDINTGDKTDLIVTNWGGGDSDSFHFFGDYLVYENYYPDLYSTEIFLYNIITGENVQLTDNPGDDYTENPCIYGNIVAWQLWEGNLADVFMYNIDSEEYIRVTNTSEFETETYPSVYDDNIVYSYFYYDKTNGTIRYGLRIYNIITGDDTSIITEEDPTGSTPEIFGNLIAYSEPGISLRVYDLITNDDIAIYEGSNLVTPWNLYEKYVAFTVLDEGIYLYMYNNPPDTPNIDGETDGEVGTSYSYTFSATDPDEDDLYYYIEWGDDTVEEWIGPYSSGEDVIVDHTWEEEGEFTIRSKVKDIYNEESDWGTLEVTMPVNKAINKLFLNFLENHPIMFSIIQRILSWF